jgi:DNA invertase Pin-like site-specific DNA recombinase
LRQPVFAPEYLRQPPDLRQDYLSRMDLSHGVSAAVTERGVGFRSLKDAWADTTTPHGRLMLTVLGGLAEFERELIRARTGEGRERAKTAGVRFGRPLKMTDHQRREALRRMDAGESVVDLARTFGVDRATLYRMQALASALKGEC